MTSSPSVVVAELKKSTILVTILVDIINLLLVYSITQEKNIY